MANMQNTEHDSIKINTSRSGESASTMGLRSRLFVGFGALLLIILVATSVILVKIHQAQQVADHVIEVELPSYDAYLELGSNIYQSQASLTAFLLTHDVDYKN